MDLLLAALASQAAETWHEGMISSHGASGMCFKELFYYSAYHLQSSGRCVRLTASVEQWKKHCKDKEEGRLRL